MFKLFWMTEFKCPQAVQVPQQPQTRQVMNQAQGLYRDPSQEQKELGPETGLEDKAAMYLTRVHPGDKLPTMT